MRRMTDKPVWRLLLVLLAIVMVAAACGNDDDDGAAGDADGNDTGGQTEGGRLAAVRDRGTLNCGVNDQQPGFGVIDESGQFTGFDVDFCRVVAAGVLGDAEAVEYVPLSAEARFTALQSDEIDVLIRNTTWTATRDGAEGSTFLFTTFYDGQGLMVPADSGITDLDGLADASICVLSGTTTELNLTAVFNARGIPFNPVVFEEPTDLRPAYEQGQCEAWTADASALAGFKASIEDEGGAEQLILPEVISKEPLGPAVKDGDSEWAQVVNWSVMVPVQAWEFGLDSSNIRGFQSDDPNIKNFLGEDGFDPGLGLDPEFAVTIVENVGNYQEIYDRHIPAIGLTLEGSPNALWTDGGLMYVPPYK